ncbi:hypothetical protein HA466_0298280 [Hirschfeldia incana]|nr:hypothetical protein HA466_0298280 [Hirschfeldia incana]
MITQGWDPGICEGNRSRKGSGIDLHQQFEREYLLLVSLVDLKGYDGYFGQDLDPILGKIGLLEKWDLISHVVMWKSQGNQSIILDSMSIYCLAKIGFVLALLFLCFLSF